MKNPDANCKCYGKISLKNGGSYYSKPELGLLSLETDQDGGWVTIKIGPNLKTLKKLMISELQFDKLSTHFVKECTVGKFSLEFGKTKIDFVADSNDNTTAECRTTFGATLLNYKNPNNYGNKVHDLSLPNLSSTMSPATSPFPIKKTEIKTPFSANGGLNLFKGSPHKTHPIRRQTFYRKPGIKSRNSLWGANEYKRTREKYNDSSAKYSNGTMDSDEENNVQVNSEDRSPSNKATYKDDNFHRRKSIPCHVQNTSPNSKMTKNRFYGNYSQDSNKRFSNHSKLSCTPPSKRQSLLSIDSAPKKSKLDFEIDNKENEGEGQNLPIGFPNLGNTCYLNAGLRAIYAAITSCSSGEAAFMNAIRKINKDHFGQYFCHLLLLSKKLQSENLCENIKETLGNLKEEFQKRFPSFSGNDMQDAQEFLSELLSSIGTDPGNNTINNSIKGDSSNMPIPDYFFKYAIKQIKKCTNCSTETSIDEIHRDCPINVLKDINERNIQSSLAFAFKNSATGNCEKCQFNGCTFSSKIILLPRILMVYIKRYDRNAAKTFDTLKVPKYITLDPFCDQNAALSILPEEYKSVDETCLNGYSGGANAHKGSLNGYSNGLNGHSCASDSMNNGSGENKSDIVDEKNGDLNEMEFLENVELEDEEEAIERAKRLSLEFEALPVISSNDKEISVDESEEEIKISKELRDNFLTGTLPHSYRLISCVRHDGISTNGGHYVSCSYDVKRKTFFFFNDSHVSEISEETFYSKASGGYIFMYLNNGVCLDNITRCSAINK